MMGMTKTGWVLGSGRWRALGMGAAVLAAVGVVGAVPTAVASASPQQALTWAEPEQSPAVSPSARAFASMAYDSATKTVMLFGGVDAKNDTWTWNGTKWTEHDPATSPGPRWQAAMADDTAAGTVMLFGGVTNTTGCKGPHRLLQDTWTWG
jgi:hypothetical protein